MTWQTITAVVFGLVAPVPALLLAVKMTRLARVWWPGPDVEGLRIGFAGLFWILFFFALFAYAGNVLAYQWEWFQAGLESTPVQVCPLPVDDCAGLESAP